MSVNFTELYTKTVSDVSISDLLQDPQLRTTTIACVSVLLVVLVLLYVSRASRRGGKTVVLVGPCNSGKTVMFLALTRSSASESPGCPGTVASMQENVGMVKVLDPKDKVVGTVSMVDVPGHAKLRHKVERYLADAKAVIFLVDATDITPHRVEAAEELFEVLTHPAVARRRLPILLAANKMDLELTAHSTDFIRKTLEKQLDSMRKTRGALSPEVAARVSAALGKSERLVTLAGLRSPMTVAGVSAEKGDLRGVHDFLAQILRS